MPSANNDAVTLAVIAILATCVGALVWIIKFLFSKMLPMIEQSSKTTVANTKATKAADKYLRERNGRDAEMHEQQIKAIQAIPKAVQSIADNSVKAIEDGMRHVPMQHVEHQHIDKEIVKSKKHDS